jgi:hypothetical protein
VQKNQKGITKGQRNKLCSRNLIKFHYFADTTERGDRGGREGDFIMGREIEKPNA